MMTFMWALYAREVKRFQKIWVDTVATPVISTVLYLTIFGVITGGRSVTGTTYSAFVYAGLLAMMVVNSSFSNPIFGLILSKNVGTIVDIQLSPIAPWRIGVAYAAAALTRGVLTVIIATSLTIWFIPGIALEHPFTFLLALCLTGLEFGMIGVTFGLLMKNFETLTLLMTFVMQPMIMLSGVFYPIATLATPWNVISQWNPLHHNVNLIRYGMIGYSDASPTLSLSVIVILSIICFFVMNRIAAHALRK